MELTKIRNRLLLLFLVCSPAFAFGQSLLQRRCPTISPTPSWAKFQIQADGDLTVIPCINRTIEVSLDTASLAIGNFTPLVSATAPFRVGSGVIDDTTVPTFSTSGSWFNSLFQTKLRATGDSKFYAGAYIYLRMTGSHTNSSVYGVLAQANPRPLGGETTSTTDLYGGSFTGHAESSVTNTIGVYGAALKGNINTSNAFTGVRGIAAVGYNGATTSTGGEFTVRQQGGFSGTTTTGRSVWAKLEITSGPATITDARGLDLSGWSNASGTFTASCGICADTSIDLGATRYFIKSTSTSQSLLSGDLTVGGAGKFYVSTSQTPASAAATCTAGQIVWDASFVYICIATNTWKRAAIATW